MQNIASLGNLAALGVKSSDQIPSVNFNPTTATFTPGMAKRATSVFATSPIIQGKADGSGVTDRVYWSPGNAIAGSYFYANIDLNQGSICFRIIPEWNGNDGIDHYFYLDANGGGAIVLAKTSANNLSFTFSGQTILVSIASWVAGTTYNVVCRWDIKNTLDGTNYGCISINDVHTFGASTKPTTTTAPSTQNVGSLNGTQSPANALIEGLTIFRRTLWDGDYGTNVGNGDEVALISAGIDPTSLGGSWDVPLCVPTNQTAGALATGTGEAWSHPWASNVLTDTYLSQGYYGGGAWGVKLTGAQSIDLSSDAAFDDLPTVGDFTLETWKKTNTYDASAHYLFWKENAPHTIGFRSYFSVDGVTLTLQVNYADTDINKTWTITPSNSYNKVWRHFALVFDSASGTFTLFVDGISHGASAAGVGAYQSEAAEKLYVGGNAPYETYGWTRVSNNKRYTANFIPLRTPPAPDANTLGQWNMTEGTGTTLDNVETTASRDGTITGVVNPNSPWEPQWVSEGTPVIPTSISGGVSFTVTIPTDATINNLMDNAMTIDGWIKAAPSLSTSTIIYKGTGSTTGWRVRLSSGSLQFQVFGAITNSIATTTGKYNDSRWHHFVATYDDAGDRKARIKVDGGNEAIGTAVTGAVVDDSASTGIFTANGIALGWQQWSNINRYTGTTYTIPSRIINPAGDANSMGLWYVNEGAGTTVTDSSGNANHGTITGTYTWLNTPETLLDAPGARIFHGGFDVGSDGVDDGFKLTLVNRDVVQNGGFGSATGWSLGAGWSIAGGVAHHDIGSLSFFQQTFLNQQNGGGTIGRMYKVVFTVTFAAGTSVTPFVGVSPNGTPVGASGTYTQYIRATGIAANIGVYCSADFHGDIDNISCTEVQTSCLLRGFAKTGGTMTAQSRLVVYDETNTAVISQIDGDWSKELCANGTFTTDTLWSKGIGWTIDAGDSNVASSDGSQTSSSDLEQVIASQTNGGIYIGGLYKVVWTVSGYSAGSLQSRCGTGLGRAATADGTYTDYIRCAGNTSIIFRADANFIGSLDNVSVTRISEYNQPNVLMFSFELPTAARGAASDCTSLSIKLLNAAGAGVLSWDQCELLPNLLDNPSLDTGAVADPWIPYGQNNDGLDVGDTERETTICHSTGGSIQGNAGASSEGTYQNVNYTTGKFYSFGAWFYNQTNVSKQFNGTGAGITPQSALSGSCRNTGNVLKYWQLKIRVARAILTGANLFYNPYFTDGAADERYFDDSFMLLLTDIPITVTPASAANSLEGTGIRVDGLDSATLSSSPLTSIRGKLRMKVTPRHSAADMVKFGNSSGYIATIYGDANNKISLYASAANTLTLTTTMNSVATSQTWDCTGALVAGTAYIFEIVYTPIGAKLKVNGSEKISVTAAIAFVTAPTTIYAGSTTTGISQFDAVYESV